MNRNYNKLLGKEVKIGDLEGEITNKLGVAFLEVTYFNVNDGKTIIEIGEVDKYLV